MQKGSTNCAKMQTIRALQAGTSPPRKQGLQQLQPVHQMASWPGRSAHLNSSKKSPRGAYVSNTASRTRRAVRSDQKSPRLLPRASLKMAHYSWIDGSLRPASGESNRLPELLEPGSITGSGSTWFCLRFARRSRYMTLRGDPACGSPSATTTSSTLTAKGRRCCNGRTSNRRPGLCAPTAGLAAAVEAAQEAGASSGL